MPEAHSPTTPTDAPARHQGLSRIQVGDIAVRLFHERGYEATSATEIAEAAGLSRSTFFRQFRSKDDVIFADHDELLDHIAAYFGQDHADPWTAVCDAAIMVFEQFHARLDIVRLRDQVVRESEILRDRETVMVSRYEKTFSAYLRRQPGISALSAIRFAAAVTATHNFELRRLIRAAEPFGPQELAAALADVRHLLRPADVEADAHADAAGASASPGAPASALSLAVPSDIVVAVFPASTPPADLARLIAERLATTAS
ncbi:TetR family transcriptional regulator [Cryobacterium melibiosiphilum]|uniref:TetR family transcriptional regulator n=1 Tax=Cryobacterium melibiosiphilum TaxID=995039 RepID=A0A3A5MLF2_9MICO|nr:TetR/AcrR family transcriptional regulator [Cryobacterium melibiosiphilum]RJT87673.1 TetR family transcriptional regulator [Cryobacterium melibiosiphilum]